MNFLGEGLYLGPVVELRDLISNSVMRENTLIMLKYILEF